jgi:membrane protein implicated in regulation of membrane protease activity
VTFLHLLVLALGIVAALVVADLLGHRGVGPWPVGLAALALALGAGLLYSPWLAALSLGLALGAAVVIVASWTRTLVARRHARREQTRRAQDARRAQLEDVGTSRR